MALGASVISGCSRELKQNFCGSDENLCANCFNMQDHIKLLTTELKSAHLIIKILQDELQSKVSDPTTTVNLPTCVNHNPHNSTNSESVSESEWIDPRRNIYKFKLPKNTSRCLKYLTPHFPHCENRFEPLSNLQDDIHQPIHVQHNTQPPQLTKTNYKK
jgi:hypothetical protein